MKLRYPRVLAYAWATIIITTFVGIYAVMAAVIALWLDPDARRGIDVLITFVMSIGTVIGGYFTVIECRQLCTSPLILPYAYPRRICYLFGDASYVVLLGLISVPLLLPYMHP